jgi:glycosyltransferase involved in cell wall biosynthesis
MIGMAVFIITKLITVFADIVSVNNPVAKYTIIKYYRVPKKKVYQLAFGVNSQNIFVPKDEARRRLGLSRYNHVILFFGYLSYYKGLEILIEAYKILVKIMKGKTVLIVAGGPHPRLIKSSGYQRWLNRLVENSKDIKNGEVLFTGFIPDEDIYLYYYASDLVVLPYKTYIASSGPLHLALEYGVPFIVSHYINEDFLSELPEDILVDPEPQILASRIKYLLERKDKLERIKNALIQVRDRRNWNNIVNDLVEFLKDLFDIGPQVEI